MVLMLGRRSRGRAREGLATSICLKFAPSACSLRNSQADPTRSFLHDLDAFWKTLTNVRRMDPTLLQGVAMSGNWVARCPAVTIGCVMATLSAPAKFVQNDIANIFNAQDLKAADNKKSDAVKAAQNMLIVFKGIGE